jgi:hypothetical protein
LVYFFKHKSETQATIKAFTMEVKRQHKSTILMIRSDNGSEFKNYTLNEFLDEEGVRQQYSTPYTPQQNGVAERKNKTLMDAARMMMAKFISPYNFWAEAISTACHATNRLYLRKGLNKTPYEITTENKPNIKYFRVFGCKCYIINKGTRLSKFESKADEGIFVGYSTSLHAYRIYNKTTGFVIETSNMHFDEDNGSHVGQGGVCDVDDVIPLDAIRGMGVGFSSSLRNTIWRKEKDHAPIAWSLHLHKINKPHKIKPTMKKLMMHPQVTITMIKIYQAQMNINQALIKIKVKMKLKANLKLKSKAKFKLKTLIQIVMVKVRTQTLKMTMLLPKNPFKKHTLTVKTRLPPLFDAEASLLTMYLEVYDQMSPHKVNLPTLVNIMLSSQI